MGGGVVARDPRAYKSTPPSKCQELREKNAGHVAAEHRLLQPQTALAVTQQVGRPGASFANSKV